MNNATSNTRPNRRDFLKTTAGIAAAPYILTSSCARAEESKNDRLRVGCIGVGGRGAYVGNIACQLGQKIACADVNRRHAERFAGAGGKCAVYKDYRKLLDRKDIDVVVIGTPDHWHTKIVIDAVKAGKDVYCEKPLTLTIDEGKKLCEAVKQTGRVVQVGTQQRSSGQFLTAVAIARSGRLGKKLRATCSLGSYEKYCQRGPFKVQAPPAELDWDFWLGQTPKVPYCKERCSGLFRLWLEYSGGQVTDWGAHHMDIVLWALGGEHTGVVEAEGKGDFLQGLPEDVNIVDFLHGKVRIPPRYNCYNVAWAFDCNLSLPNGNSINLVTGNNEMIIEGEKGRIRVNRGGLTGKPIEELTQADRDWLAEEVVRLYKGKTIDPFRITTNPSNSGVDEAATPDHMRNLFACVRDRSQPASDVFTHCNSVNACHLANIAMLLKRKVRFDPNKREFIGDAEANQLLSRPQREPYTIEA